MPPSGIVSSPRATAITVNARQATAIWRNVSARASYRGANRSIATIWNDWATAFPSTRALPSAEPPGTPFSISNPATASATPTQAAAATGVRKRTSAMIGVSTT